MRHSFASAQARRVTVAGGAFGARTRLARMLASVWFRPDGA